MQSFQNSEEKLSVLQKAQAETSGTGERLPANKAQKPKEPGFVSTIVKVTPEVLPLPESMALEETRIEVQLVAGRDFRTE